MLRVQLLSRRASGCRIAKHARARWSRALEVCHAAEVGQAAPAEWSGLAQWRAKGVDHRRVWGPKGPAAPQAGAHDSAPPQPAPVSLVEAGLSVLNTADPAAKCRLTHAAWDAYYEGRLPLGAGPAAAGLALPDRPARPARPPLVVPKLVPSPKESGLPLAAHLLHNLSHIELNAIDLAWDTVVRFAPLGLPATFYADFARVADDESRHFGWCTQRMAELGHAYGDIPAHDLLWQGCEVSAGDLQARLAIVPMSQEARGLDAGQRLAERLVGAKDKRSAAMVSQIALEERAHVAVGVAWFGRVCAAQGLDASAAFRAWLTALAPDLLKGPFNHEERHAVGLTSAFYDPESWPPSDEREGGAPTAATPAAQAPAGERWGPAGAASSGSAAGEQHSAVPGASQQPPAFPAHDPAALQQLRARLESMLAGELVAGQAAAAAGGGG